MFMFTECYTEFKLAQTNTGIEVKNKSRSLKNCELKIIKKKKYINDMILTGEAYILRHCYFLYLNLKELLQYKSYICIY